MTPSSFESAPAPGDPTTRGPGPGPGVGAVTGRADGTPRAWTAAVAAVLALVTFALYFQVRGHAFTTYDDGSYVFANPHVRDGLTADSIRWAFTRSHSSNWHPLTWMSHMLDKELFGMRPGGHHLMSAALHALNGALLLFALRAMRCPLWPAAFVAAVFALHPQRVESVAWASERKDVLSGLFWMLSLWAYAAYARRPGVARYLLVTLTFVLGLLAKPMVVTLPVVLLLLDVWPLRRVGPLPSAPQPASFARAGVPRLVLEKVPWLVLAAASSVVTVIVQSEGGAVRSLLALSFEDRVANAFTSTVAYLAKTLWPTDLAVFYPHAAIVDPGGFRPLGLAVLGSAALLVALSAVALVSVRRRPWVTTGWLWTVVTLAPVIGIVQVGEQAYADRYTYLTTIGFWLALTWTGRELAQHLPALRVPVVGAAALFLAACALLTHRQIGHWRDTEALFEHALAVTDKNYVAFFNLGVTLEQRDPERARDCYERALAIRPDATDARYNLGVVDMRAGRTAEAETAFRRVLQLRPDKLSAVINLGIVLAQQERDDEAIEVLERALELHPRSIPAHTNLAKLHAKRGDAARARALYEAALRFEPNAVNARFGLGVALLELGEPNEAQRAFEQVKRQDPTYREIDRWLNEARRAARGDASDSGGRGG